MTLVYLSLAWLVGTYLGFQLNWPWAWLSGGAFALLLASFPLWRRRKGLLLGLLSLVILLAAALRLQSSLPPPDEANLAFYQGQQIKLLGRISDIPLTRRQYQQLTLEAQKLLLSERTIPIEGTALAWLPPYPAYHYGDLLAVKGKFEEPQKKGPGGRVSGLLFSPQVELISPSQEGPMATVHSWRLRLASVLAQALPQPQAALGQGLLLGLRGDIPTELRSSFVQSGTAHLLSISGLHVTVLLGVLLGIGAWAWGRHRPYYLILAFLGLWLYILFSGLNPPALRAGIMGSLFLVGLWLGRPRAGLTALALAAALMVGIEPSLLYQVSFQLTFAAMAGLLLLSPYFQAWGKKAFLPQPINDGLAYSLGATMGSYPLIAYHFQLISVVGVLATLLALPVLAPIIILSALVAVAGLVAMPLAQVLGWLDWLFLSYLKEVATLFASLPQAFVRLREVDPSYLWAYYGALALFLFRPFRLLPWLKAKGAWAYSRLPLKPLALALFSIALLVWIAYFTLPDLRLRVSFLDVGQGDAILIQQGSRQILVDGGPDPQKLALALDKRLPFWDRSLDGVVLTHPQADHLNGLLEVLRRYEVGWALEPGMPFSSEAYKEWLRLLKEKQIPSLRAQAGQKISLGSQANLVVLHPQREFMQGTEEDLNNNSVVLRLEAGEVSFLLTGDIGQEAELELLLRGVKLKSIVLKVAHHGSATSTSFAFLAVVRPQVAVISVGKDNPLGHPSPDVVDRLAQILGQDRIYLTSERGTIELLTDSKRLRVKMER